MLPTLKSFDKIRISIASPNVIREWSYGEVKKPETINYRTLRPERDGLFCERIFGTTKEYECYCGKFKSIRYKGVVCDKCGVEVTHFKVRRERMGHIELASPVAHIWYYRNSPSRIGLLLNTSMASVRSVLYFERYIVIDPGDTQLNRGDLLTEEEYLENIERYGDAIRIGIGAEGIRDMLKDLKLEEEVEKLRQEMNKKGIKADRRLRKRLEIFEDFLYSGNKPEWMVMDVIPVIPPELRPMVQLDGGRFATSDLNDLYRRVINRNIRLRRLLLLRAPDIIIRNEKRMLQEAVDALFDNSRRKKVVKGPGNRPLKSLSDMLKGKQGRFRQNLLGKRVDYSGRSVIVVGPTLKLHQCGLPKKMAVELFKPFIMKKLVEKNSAYNIKSAKKIVEEGAEEVWGALEEIVREHPVLLNRAPTLHRLGIQAFEPILVEGKAIQLHPLVCHAYNADFDGDQMAVHVPLSAEAQIEAWTLMLAPHNLLNPASGEPIVNPTQDIVLGINYLTRMRNGSKGEGKSFSSFREAILAVDNNVIDHQARIKVLAPWGDMLETTVGRILFNEVAPAGMEYQNNPLDSKTLARYIHKVYLKFGPSATVGMIDRIKELGFKSATLFGATISLDDIVIPSMKGEEIKRAKKEVEVIQHQYQQGLITNEERAQKVIDLWTSVNERITEAMMNNLRQDQDGFNPIFIMADSGARGSKQQIRQLAGMRGLMATPSGEIIELPIISNFKEGLTVQEYFISTHGARKGLSDTALKTADAGYLTRRLVDIAQGITVSDPDCGTIKGVVMHPIKEGDEIIEPLRERIVGFFSTEKITDPRTGAVLVQVNQEINEDVAQLIEGAGIEEVRIRHPLTCESPLGVCQKCYGRNLATGTLVPVGEAVGVIAAQSIGQPGTQLTMRTFHIGGTAAKQVEENEVRVGYPVYIEKLPDTVIDPGSNVKITARKGEMLIQRVYGRYEKAQMKDIAVQKDARVLIGQVVGTDKAGKEVKASHMTTAKFTPDGKALLLVGNVHTIPIKVGTMFSYDEDMYVEPNAVIAEFDSYNEPIIAEKSGVVRYQDVILGRTMIEDIDEITGNKTKLIQEFKDERLQPKILIIPNDGSETFESDVPNGAHLTVDDGQKVKAGETIAKTTRVVQKSRDITGGLPRVQELFEAQHPKDPAVMARIDGEVELEGTVKGKKVVLIKNEYGDVEKHLVPIGKYLLVRNGDKVKAGTQLCDGTLDPHDILDIKGELALQQYLLDEVQEVYHLQGVNINDKHLAVIIRQMLRRVEIVDPGDTRYIVGEFVDKYEFMKENERNIKEGGAPARAKPVLLGLTKAALHTESFFSAASFQETTKVLTNAAIKGKTDNLLGLKENVIIGHMIPAGTGIRSYGSISVFRKKMGDIVYSEEPVKEEVKLETQEITV
ncbi:MAG: DNA-directed RNA polymerase subunit beta' [Spirochaetes bacterium]|nr:DNA-directed RNA polymerase subunit beta' [Spirochaetota bacterium]